VIDLFTHKVICVATGHGPQHDFALFKAARLPLLPAIALLADSGYRAWPKTIATATPRTKTASTSHFPPSKNKKTGSFHTSASSSNTLCVTSNASASSPPPTETGENALHCVSTSSPPLQTSTNDFCKRSTGRGRKPR